MKDLLAVLFTFVFFGIIIACLPTIMGLFFLCVIACFIYKSAKSLFEDGTERTDAGHDGRDRTSKQNRNSERQSIQHIQNSKSETEKKQNSYSGYSYSKRSSGYDSYDDYYDDYCDDDMPPEEGDCFHGTGGPFL